MKNPFFYFVLILTLIIGATADAKPNTKGSRSRGGSTYGNSDTCKLSTNTWINESFGPMTKTFSASFDATPSTSSVNGIVALSETSGSTFGDFAVLLRLNAQGLIDARCGDTYSALNNITYQAGGRYAFRVIVNPLRHLYSAYVTPQGGAEQTVVRACPFRTEQADTSSFGNWGIWSGNAPVEVCNFTSETRGNQPPSADAGADQTKIDTDDNGTESFTLNGTSSSDPEGPIVRYLWTENDVVLADGANAKPTVNFSIGTHTVQLRVFDETGDAATDTVIIRLNPPGSGGSCELAGPHNTGPDESAKTNYSGEVVLDQPGQIFENFNVFGTITVRANNVIIRNGSVFPWNTNYGIRTDQLDKDHSFEFPWSGIEIRNVFIGGTLSNPAPDSAALLIGGHGFAPGDGVKVYNVEMGFGGTDAVKGFGNIYMETIWAHHHGANPEAHADCVQVRQKNNHEFCGFYCDLSYSELVPPWKSNSAFIIQSAEGNIDNTIIRESMLNGGNFTIFIQDKYDNDTFGCPTNTRIENNLLGSRWDHASYGDYQYGLLYNCDSSMPPLSQNGNICWRTGLPPVNNQCD